MLRALTTNLNILTIIAVLLLLLSWWVLWHTPFGLRLRSCGEAPQAAETLGVNVIRYKFIAVLISGGLAGLAGGFLVLVASNLYREGQVAGRGYIGLAAMIFGNWRTGGLAGGAALFGYTDAIQLRGGGDVVRAYLLPIAIFLVAWGVWILVRRRQGKPVVGVVTVILGILSAVWFLGVTRVSNEFTGMTPYVATLLVLAFASQRLRPPAADGQVYRKGEARDDWPALRPRPSRRCATHTPRTPVPGRGGRPRRRRPGRVGVQRRERRLRCRRCAPSAGWSPTCTAPAAAGSSRSSASAGTASCSCPAVGAASCCGRTAVRYACCSLPRASYDGRGPAQAFGSEDLDAAAARHPA